MSKFLSDEGWFMRAVFGVALLVAGFNILFLLAYTALGVLGQGWHTDAMYTSLLVVVFVTNWGRARYWRRRALAAEERRVDVTTGGPGMLSLHDGTTPPEVLEAMDRARARRNASYGFARR